MQPTFHVLKRVRRAFWWTLALLMLLGFSGWRTSGSVTPPLTSSSLAILVAVITLLLMSFCLSGNYAVFKLLKSRGHTNALVWATFTLPMATSIIGLAGSVFTGFLWLHITASTISLLTLLWLAKPWRRYTESRDQATPGPS